MVRKGSLAGLIEWKFDGSTLCVPSKESCRKASRLCKYRAHHLAVSSAPCHISSPTHTLIRLCLFRLCSRRQVWRSIRDWDPHTRGILAGYLQAAKAVVRARQSRPGVAVHIRMGGKSGGGGSAIKSSGSAGSCAAWAITILPGRSTSASGTVRIACPANAQTEVPASAVQRVQVGCGRGALFGCKTLKNCSHRKPSAGPVSSRLLPC